MFFRKSNAEKPFHRCLEQEQLQTALSRWFQAELGQQFASAEKLQFEQILPDLFGFYLLQVGELGVVDLLSASRVSHRKIMRIQTNTASGQGAFHGQAWALPIQSDSIDVVILPHTLDFALYPHEVLREVERVLIPEGQVVISGFNPLSIWQLWRWSLRWRQQPPWCGHFYTLFRLRDWLKLLGFDLCQKRHFFYRPPVKNKRIMQRLGFMESLGQRLLPIVGAGYVLVARKRVETLTPLPRRWQARKKVVGTGWVESCVPHDDNKEVVSD
jgi:SAM-dependent methyltransferase